MKKILCIEDDTDIADILDLALGDLYEVRLVTDAGDVMESLIDFTPDLILIDNYIGVVQAAEVMKEIKTLPMLKHTPFILCSGHADIKSIALQIFATAYLEKPFDLAELYATIDQTLLTPL